MNVLSIVISLFVLLFAITIHEAAHGWAAYRLGDPTAHSLGRVSLNPIVHIDPIGTVLLPLLLVFIGAPAFGWARPVPVNPFNLRHPRRDSLWISAAGPLSNLTVAAAALFLILLLKIIDPNVTYFLRLAPGFRSDLYPLQGVVFILFYAVLINTYLAIFNLIPIPPLDGSGVLAGLLSEEAAQKLERLRPYGFLIVLVMISLGLLNLIIRPIEFVIYTLVFL